ncbi:hypothetical protein B9Z55_025556 [Caenorhabditis nigoni]|uniref:Uncharacterized protein n=1 Tax=Caenorhabditis nigoni TaxID=1611254 RepID=A0A2G5SZC0_9PELO|nr:hypothetical protein B9Z55_025556 [Caenorhabditis nigoni]
MSDISLRLSVRISPITCVSRRIVPFFFLHLIFAFDFTHFLFKDISLFNSKKFANISQFSLLQKNCTTRTARYGDMTSRISQATVFSILIYSQFAQALSKISIGLRPYQYQYVDSDFNQKYIYEPESLRPTPAPKEEILKEEDIPAFKTLDFLNMPSELEGSASAFRTMNIENTATIIPADVKPIVPKPKKRKMKRKPKRKPKKMHLRRVFKTRLITTTPRPIQIEENRIDDDGTETTTNVINLAVNNY